MNSEQVRQVASRFIDQLHRLEQGDVSEAENMASLFTEGAELSNPLIEHEGERRAGRDAIARFWKEYKDSFQGIHSDFTDIMTGSQSAGLFWTSSGTAVDGRPLEYKGVTQLVLDESGKICSFTGYFDSAALRNKGS